jgi:hypothetical protein
MVMVPALDSFGAIDQFFYISLAALVGVKLTFIFNLIKYEFYKTFLSLLILLFQLAATLGCLYLYFNGRMGTGVFSTPKNPELNACFWPKAEISLGRGIISPTDPKQPATGCVATLISTLKGFP